MRPLLTLRQVAELLAVPEKTLYAWRQGGTGPPATKVGKHLRYDQGALERWLAAQTTPATPPRPGASGARRAG